MISIEKLIQAVSSFNEKPMNLPENPTFVQKTAYDLRREELEMQRTLNEDKTQSAVNVVCDYTMSKDFGVKQLNRQNIQAQQLTPQITKPLQPASHFSYVENEVIDIPNTLTNVFKGVNKQVSEWYIYGLKNPNSFFKSVLMLNNPEYILKTNTDKVNYSITFKREVAIKLDTLYRQYKYQQWNFKKLDMVHQLLNENVINYALIIATADYIKRSLIILDISKKEYQIYIAQENSTSYYLIIKDGQTFLPIMNSNGNHIFDEVLLNTIKSIYDLASIEAPFKMVTIASVSVSSNIETKLEVKENPNTKTKFIESKMTLTQIQELAKVRGLDITKEGKQGKQIAKTKKELCDEMNAME
jgi:hypothetical protein